MKHMKIVMSTIFTLLSICLVAFMYSRGPAVAQREWRQKTAIVFDLGGVLFDTDKRAAMKQMGKPAVRYALSHLVFSSNTLKNHWFNVLEMAAEHNNHAFALKTEDGSDLPVKDENGTALPAYMVEWLAGARPNQVLFDEICAGITALPNLSDADKECMMRMSRMFLAEDFVASRKILQKAVLLLEQLKQKGYPLYILSNWDEESFRLMEQTYPDIFKLFDGYVVSGYEKLVKPDPALYKKLADTFQHEQYVFLDDQKDNRVAARACGWKTVKVTSGKPHSQKLYKKIKERRDSVLQSCVPATN